MITPIYVDGETASRYEGTNLFSKWVNKP